MTVPLNPQELIVDREKTHGSFLVNSVISQSIKAVIRGQKNPKFTCQQREALDMIAHKIGRIVAGDPNFADHWDDIAGYATRVANECRLTEKIKGIYNGSEKV